MKGTAQMPDVGSRVGVTYSRGRKSQAMFLAELHFCHQSELAMAEIVRCAEMFLALSIHVLGDSSRLTVCSCIFSSSSGMQAEHCWSLGETLRTHPSGNCDKGRYIAFGVGTTSAYIALIRYYSRPSKSLVYCTCQERCGSGSAPGKSEE
jgi:hypothetical protein